MANVEIPEWLKSLPLAPEFRPTDTEFADPIAYISKIEKEASAFGICKVIPPLPKPSKRYVLNNLNRSLSRSRVLGLDVNATVAAVDPLNAVSEGRTIGVEAKAVFTTRQQELGQAVKGSKDIGCMAQSAAQKQVWQSGEVYTLEQFESKSKAFSRSVLGGIKEVTPQVIETLFWKANSEKPIYVEYANDVPGSGFGEPDRLLHYFHGRKRRKQYAQSHQGSSGCRQQDLNNLRNPSSGAVIEALSRSSYSFSEPGKEFADQPTSLLTETSLSTDQSVLYSTNELEGTAGWKLSNSPWNLQVIARSAGSLTRFLLDDIPGVTSPMVYVGMLFSWFAWHVEDHELHSLNFLHMGSPKTWYAVPGDYAFAFEEIIRTQAYGGNIDQFAALKLIGEKTTLLSPELVVASGIPCCRLVQNPGEFVVTFPRAYHVGFSHGFNCGEAANFGTPQWLAVAKDAAVRRAAMDHLPMLSHQQLLYLLTMSFIPRVPRSLLPGVRSSRLKDRLKAERELLVKRAFIEDVLKENKLLNILSERYLAFRAVLWHPDLLPAPGKDAIPETGTALDSILDKDDELSVTPVKDSNQDGLVHQLTSYVETVNDSCDDDDLSCDFQVDSGALPCVACGILGYPLMSVMQPSLKAAMELFPAEHLTLTGEAQSRQKEKSSHLQYLTKCAISVTNIDETWDTRGFLRPRVFCMEHAVQIEELLRLKGGAKMLVICHSDYQKLKVNAATVAEEIRTEFNYKEILLDSASKDELSLIDIAIDGEQFTDCQEDWTSKLGMNLRYSIKVRNSGPSKKMEALNPNYLLSVIAPGCMISTIKWCTRKSRTRRKSNHQKHAKLCDGDNSKKHDTVCESGSGVKRRGKVLLQYSRRKHRAKSRDSGAKCTSTCGVDYLPEVTDTNCRKMDACEQEISGGTFSRAMGLDSAEVHTSDSTEHRTGQRDEVNMAVTNWKCAVNIVQSGLVDSRHRDSMLQVNFPIASKLSCEATMLTKAFTSTSDNFIPLGRTTLKKKAIENPGTSGDNIIGGDTEPIAGASDLMARSSLNEASDQQQNLSTSTGSDSAFCTTGAEIMGSSVLDEACAKLEVPDHATSNVSEILHVNETSKYGISTGTDSTATMEVNMPSSQEENYTDNCKIGTQAFSLLVTCKQDIDRTMANAKVPSLNRKNGAREAAQAEVYNDFVRSPCEGLRPRKRKEDRTCKSSSNTSSLTEQKPPRKMKKSLGSSISHMLVMGGKGQYECNLEGCQMCFRSKAELLLHKRNKCHYEECGKRFRSHKYLVLHQRVHDDKRPLECTWNGCGMTFKWAWARTEHLRLHTGERPYQCKIEGCGRTFRFVSDFSRHRRKTGHYINTFN